MNPFQSLPVTWWQVGLLKLSLRASARTPPIPTSPPWSGWRWCEIERDGFGRSDSIWRIVHRTGLLWEVSPTNTPSARDGPDARVCLHSGLTTSSPAAAWR